MYHPRKGFAPAILSIAALGAIAFAPLITGESSDLGAQARRRAPSRQAPSVSKTEGLMLGAHLNATVINSPDNTAFPFGESLGDHQVSGPGIGGVVGWGFNRWFMLYTGIDGALVNMRNVGYCQRSCPDPLPGAPREKRNGKYVFAHGDVGARFSIPINNSNWVPFFNTAITLRRASSDEFEDGDIVLTGVGLTVGGGAQYFVARSVAIEASTQFTAGEMNNMRVDGERVRTYSDARYNQNSFRVAAGVRFYPPIRR